MKRFIVLLCLCARCLLLTGTLLARDRFVSTSGSDAAAGTSTSVPWLHAPGMSGCASTCLAFTPTSGDRIFLRGGDTWHFNASNGTKGLPWNITYTGSSGNMIYFGVDQTWWDSGVCGGSWCRPIMTGDNSLSGSAVGSCTSGGSTAGLISSSGTWYTLDDLEMLGLCTNNASEPGYISTWGSDNCIYSNIYMHGWTHTAGASSQPRGFDGATNSGGNNLFDKVVVDGFDSDNQSLCSMCFGGVNVQNSVFRNNANWVNNGVKRIVNSLFENIVEPYDAAHGNIMEFNNENGDAQHYVYNNVWRNSSAAVGVWLCPGTAGHTDFYFNNVEFNVTGSNGLVNFNSASDSTCSVGGTGNFFGNTFVGGALGGTSGQTWLGAFDSNYMINTSFKGPPTSQVNQIAATVANATTYGFTSGNNYVPQSSTCNGNLVASGCPIGKGSNLVSLCNTITDSTAKAACLLDSTMGPNYDSVNHRVIGDARTPKARPSSGAWDVGAFQSASDGVIAPAPSAAIFAKGISISGPVLH